MDETIGFKRAKLSKETRSARPVSHGRPRCHEPFVADRFRWCDFFSMTIVISRADVVDDD
jgi:hypothetical protein